MLFLQTVFEAILSRAGLAANADGSKSVDVGLARWMGALCRSG